MSPSRSKLGSSRHRHQAALRVRHQLQVDERRVDRGVTEPARHEVDRSAVGQQVTGVAVPEGVVSDSPTQRYRTQFHGPCGRSLYPAVGRRARSPDELFALPDVAAQLGMHWDDPGLAALPLADVEAGELALQRQVRGPPGTPGASSQTSSGRPGPWAWDAAPWVFDCAGRRPVGLS